ncbi:peptide-methionine (S)-S-oxide reductase MsrA [Methylobacillus gramineus]|uniref:peptide-methionine (S)-S-oxide reductase MsrA n=1 Tax=Methylobacillus gramineus TaxID=755169 RepID=UPI001CFF840C|nr:peptide-methionine (S)-S-oxide reductase MsrA [Methylobacillus gramineus]MCB5183589.1 peptide-methionine (S)-S-oxide reductase MsrA [Methylobacillus gramineus]
MTKSIAVLAGGCFWCTEPVFSQLNGVESVVSGYIGGQTLNPSYKDICTGETGHAEAIRITFDASLISFEVLLEIFFLIHDPTTLNRQGHDVGTQYRSAIFCQNEQQRASAEQIIESFNLHHVFGAPIVTQINDDEHFYPAEDYHQQYFAKNPQQSYCLAVAAPKVAKIRAKYADKLKGTR